MPCEEFNYQRNFNEEKLLIFLEKASLPLPNKDNILPLLESLRVVSVGKQKTVLNNAGVLFFAKNLGETFPHTKVACVLYHEKDKTTKIIDSIRLNRDIISSVEGAMTFLLKSLRVKYKIS